MFTKLGINPEITKILKDNGISEPTEIQQKTLPLLLEGKDIVGKSKTGSGKTLAYALPIIQNIDLEVKSIQALIICPTRELALQITDEIRKITSFFEGIKTTAIYGGSNIDRQIKSLKQGTKIVVGTPGRIIDHLKRKTLKLHNLQTLVLDEADEMLNMGFREDIETILKTTKKSRQTIMFSATMPKATIEITKNYMNDPILVETVGNESAIDKIEQSYAFTKDKQDYLLDFILRTKPKQCIIFCNTKKMVDNLTSLFAKNQIDALGIHGDKRQNERTKIMSQVKQDTNTIILIATDVAARGIDIKDVDYVINYDIPQSFEYYIHRVGRTARAGKTGIAITLVNTQKQIDELHSLEKYIGTKMKEIETGDKPKANKPRKPETKRPTSNFKTKSFEKSRSNSYGDKRKSYSDKKTDGEKRNYSDRKNSGDKRNGNDKRNSSDKSTYEKRSYSNSRDSRNNNDKRKNDTSERNNKFHKFSQNKNMKKNNNI